MRFPFLTCYVCSIGHVREYRFVFGGNGDSFVIGVADLGLHIEPIRGIRYRIGHVAAHVTRITGVRQRLHAMRKRSAMRVTGPALSWSAASAVRKASSCVGRVMRSGLWDERQGLEYEAW